MPSRDFTDWDLEDRREMERQCIEQFVDESQLVALTFLWERLEKPDNLAYIRWMDSDDN